MSKWLETTIGDQATLQRGIDITKVEQRPGKVPVISSGGISSYHDTVGVKGPGVVLGRKGVVGSVFYVEEDYWPHDTSLWVKDFHGNFPRFVYYFFKSVAPQIARMDVGSANPTLNRNHVHPMPIVWPPLAEQKAIAAVLGALDDKIELNRRMNATLEAMARALFQSWFVDFDPVRAKLDGRKPIGLDETTAALFPDSFQDSPIGPIPHAWIVKDLGEIADFDKGLSYKGEGLAEEGGMPMVNLGCFTGRGLFNANRVKRYTGAYRERHLVRAGDLVIANTDMTQNRVIIGSPAIVPELNGVREFLFTHHVFAVRFKPDADVWRRYAFFTLLKPEFREIAEGFSTGTTVLALPRDGLANYSLCLPPILLLEAFEKQVGPILATVDANLHQSRTLAKLRDTLLPKLLSGELSVTVNPTVSTKS
jgi:type I restriction enzyme S subunit